MTVATAKISPTNSTLHKSITLHIKRFREGLCTRKNITTRMGSSTGTLAKIEKTGRRLDVGEYLRICKALSIDPVKLLYLLLDNAEVKITEVRVPANSKHGLAQQGLKDFGTTSALVGKIVGAQLKALRESKAMSMRETADILGIQHSYICKIERPTRRLDIGELVQVCAVYGVAACDVLETVIEIYNEQQAA